MALYSCSVSNIKRSDGRSSVAKAAYNSRSRLEDTRTGNIYDYSLKKDLGFSEIITPDNAPSWMSDRQELWAKNELVNKRRDARVAKEILVALPRELDTNQQINLIREFVQDNLISLGVVADINAHELEPSNEPDWNPHVHILISTQHIEGEEFGQKITELNKKDFVVNLRKNWADYTNKALELAGSKERVDHRSLKELGVKRIPQIHLGHKVWAMKQKGIATERGDRHVEIEKRNQEIVNNQLNMQRVSGLDVVRNSMPGSIKKQVNYVSSKPEINYSDISQPKEKRIELAQSLIKQIGNQREINKHLRTEVGKLVVLVNRNQITVCALSSGSSKNEQEKLVLKRKETGWEITKYELSNHQRNTLLRVIEKVEQKLTGVEAKSSIQNSSTETQSQYSFPDTNEEEISELTKPPRKSLGR